MTTVRKLCISGDSHVVEPPEVFHGLEKRFGDRAPRMMDVDDRKDVLVLGNGKLGPGAGGFLTAGMEAGTPETREMAKRGFEIARPGVLNVPERLKDQAFDGVDAEVIYPTMMFGIYQLQDAEIINATFASYNDWVTNYCSPASDRLFPLSCIQLYDIDFAISEMKRAKNMGHVGVCVPASAPPETPYSDHYYDPFWAAAEELGQPLCFHLLTGATPRYGLPDWGKMQYTMASTGISLTIGAFILGGVCERFPNLQLVPTEFETGWIGHFLQRFDWSFLRMGGRYDSELKMMPSDYFHRQFHVTFEDDEIGIRTRDIIGVDNLIWGSDYPHFDSIFPNSQSILDRICDGVPDVERRKMTAGNVCKLYDLPFEV